VRYSGLFLTYLVSTLLLSSAGQASDYEDCLYGAVKYFSVDDAGEKCKNYSKNLLSTGFKKRYRQALEKLKAQNSEGDINREALGIAGLDMSAPIRKIDEKAARRNRETLEGENREKEVEVERLSQQNDAYQRSFNACFTAVKQEKISEKVARMTCAEVADGEVSWSNTKAPGSLADCLSSNKNLSNKSRIAKCGIKIMKSPPVKTEKIKCEVGEEYISCDAIKIARDFIRDVNPYIKIEDGAKNIYYDPSLDRLVTVDNTSRTIIQGKQKADEAVSPSANAVPK